MINENEMTSSQVRTLKTLIKSLENHVVKSIEVESFDFCDDVKVLMVAGNKDISLFDKRYLFFIGSNGQVSNVWNV